MTGVRRPVLIGLGLLAAVVVQTTLFGRVRLGGIAPDIVILSLILFTVRARADVAMLTGFSVGLLVDAVAASSALGLRAAAYTTVAFVAVKSRDRAEFGPVAVALWAGAMTLVGVSVILIVGTLFGQLQLDFGEATRRALLIPAFNFVITLFLSPLTTRLLDGRPGVIRF